MKNKPNIGWLPRWLLSICVFGVTLVVTATAFSAEQAEAQVVEEKSSETPATVQEPGSVQQSASEKKTDVQPRKKAVESPDVFNPSEEISEDFAVAFPVDI